MSSPSIQSFYPKQTASSGFARYTDGQNHDGFTQAELDAPTSPLARVWNPTVTYREVAIGDVLPGAENICFSGRIVNYRPSELDRKGGQYSKPWHFLVVKDDTGVIGVKLTPIGIPISKLILGGLVTVWVTYIGDPSSTPCTIPFVTSCTRVNPERGTKQFIRFVEDTPETALLHRVPFGSGLSDETQKARCDLMTLGAYSKTGHDGVHGATLLVCVSSIGKRRHVRKTGTDQDLELMEVIVCDNTGSCTLTLWEDKINSARLWIPNETVLLFINPKQQLRRNGCTAGQSSVGIGIDHTTLVDVDPRCPDADWLRKWAKDRLKKEAVCVPFPQNTWDAEDTIHDPVRALFTIAEVDEFARSDPRLEFTGKLSLLITDMGLLNLWQRKMLCCADCCGVPLYANITLATCRNCRSPRHLSFNPRIMGTLVDETGCVEKGKLIWSTQAWKELFLPDQNSELSPQTDDSSPAVVVDDRPDDITVDEVWRVLTKTGVQSIREIEERLMYSRVTLTFGWAATVERLCVLGVE